MDIAAGLCLLEYLRKSILKKLETDEGTECPKCTCLVFQHIDLRGPLLPRTMGQVLMSTRSGWKHKTQKTQGFFTI